VPTPFSINQASHLLQPWDSGPDYVINRHLATEKNIVIRLRNPAVRQIVGKKDVKGFIDAHNV
jgi:hypothetical protein